MLAARTVRRRVSGARVALRLVPARIVLFGATGYTGRLTAERLVALGERPLLAGRSEERLASLAEDLGGLEWRRADVFRRNSVFDLVSEGDVLLSTVGPFAKWGEPAVGAAIAARGTYLDSTGEPAFIRRVFEEWGPSAARGGARAADRDGLRLRAGRPGRRAGARGGRRGRGARGRRLLRARRRAGRRSARGQGVARRRFAERRLRVPRRAACIVARPAERVRDVPGEGQDRAGGVRRRRRALHAAGGLSAAARGQRLPGLVRGAGAADAGGDARRLGRREACRACAAPCRSPASASSALTGSPEAGTTPGGLSWIAAEAFDASGLPLAEVHLSGADAYAFTAAFLAWASRRAAGRGRLGAGPWGRLRRSGSTRSRRGAEFAGLARVPSAGS